MDRGTVKINGLPLVDFVNTWWFEAAADLDGASSVPLLPLLQMLFRQEMTWYTGRALFSDTLLTCVLCHRNVRFYASSSASRQSLLLCLSIESVLTVAALVSQLTAAAPVNYEEDFHANLYGMAWWTARDEDELEQLLERLLGACRDSSGVERFYLARYYVSC